MVINPWIDDGLESVDSSFDDGEPPKTIFIRKTFPKPNIDYEKVQSYTHSATSAPKNKAFLCFETMGPNSSLANEPLLSGNIGALEIVEKVGSGSCYRTDRPLSFTTKLQLPKLLILKTTLSLVQFRLGDFQPMERCTTTTMESIVWLFQMALGRGLSPSL
jgi:hypothetical protein